MPKVFESVVSPSAQVYAFGESFTVRSIPVSVLTPLQTRNAAE
jgi:hypothetical protein